MGTLGSKFYLEVSFSPLDSLNITVADRVRLTGLKTFNFKVQIQRGNCNNLGEIVAGQYCSGCTNSLGVAIVKDKDGEEIILSSLSDTHSVVFFDSKKNNAKLGCGEITNGLLVETS